MPWAVSVMMPTWLPVKLIASTPRSASAMHTSAMRDPLAGGEQHVHLAPGLGRRHVVGQRDQVVGRLAHRRDHDDDVVAVAAGERHVLGDGPDAVGVGDRRAAVLLDDQGHGVGTVTGLAAAWPGRFRSVALPTRGDRQARTSEGQPPAAPGTGRQGAAAGQVAQAGDPDRPGDRRCGRRRPVVLDLRQLGRRGDDRVVDHPGGDRRDDDGDRDPLDRGSCSDGSGVGDHRHDPLPATTPPRGRSPSSRPRRCASTRRRRTPQWSRPTSAISRSSSTPRRRRRPSTTSSSSLATTTSTA